MMLLYSFCELLVKLGDHEPIKKGTSREGAFGGKRMLLSGFAFGVCDASLDGFHRGLGLDFGSLGFDHAIVLGVG